jgi:MbtH protein
MTDAFDDEHGIYVVLRDERGQHCLWPPGVPVPAGWETALGPAARQACQAYVERHWSVTLTSPPVP